VKGLPLSLKLLRAMMGWSRFALRRRLMKLDELERSGLMNPKGYVAQNPFC